MKQLIKYLLLLTWIVVAIPAKEGYGFINKIAPTWKDKLDIFLVGAMIATGFAVIWSIMAVVASL